ncbi:hypothetical protein HDE_06765 [Halotydeus destructor]|nr:hypothetical protein HDE_06765 [Halotydeus destructor]
MSSPQYYSAFNNMLSVSGLGSNYDSKIARFFNGTMLIVHVVNCLTMIVTDTLSLSLTQLYSYLRKLSMITFSLISIKVIKDNQSILIRSLQLGEVSLSNEQKVKLAFRSYVMIATTAIDFLIRATANMAVILTVDEGISVAVAVYNIAKFRLINTLAIVVLQMYIFFCLTYGEIMVSHIRSVSRTDISLHQLERSLTEIEALIRAFDHKMAAIPLSWFSITFASLLSKLIQIKKVITFARNLVLETFAIYMVSFYLLAVLSLVIIVASVDQYVRKEYRMQYGAILRREGLSEKTEYLRSHEKDYRFTLSVFGLFELNKKVILSYISALVTFTILFMQLNHAM